MKKAAVLISIILAVCSLSACDKIGDPLNNEGTSSAASEVSSAETDAASNNKDTESVSDSDTGSESKREESKKEESKKEESKKDESKKTESKKDERGDSIPSRSDKYEATPKPESKPESKQESETETESKPESDTDSTTDTNTDTSSDTEGEEKPEPPYLSGMWIVEKIVDSEGNEVDGRSIYGSSFNYAGVLDLDEEGEFKLTIGIVPEGQVNEGLYEQRDKTLVLQYNDEGFTQIFCDVTKLDDLEVLALPVTVGGKDYTIYFSR